MFRPSLAACGKARLYNCEMPAGQILKGAGFALGEPLPPPSHLDTHTLTHTHTSVSVSLHTLVVVTVQELSAAGVVLNPSSCGDSLVFFLHFLAAAPAHRHTRIKESGGRLTITL